MFFNLSKSKLLTITNVCLLAISDYHIEGCAINNVDSCKYLGVTNTNNLSWSKHITNIVSKAHSVSGEFKAIFILGESKSLFCFYRPTSLVVDDFNPEKNGIEAILVSFEMLWLVVQCIENPKKSLLGKIFYREFTFSY